MTKKSRSKAVSIKLSSGDKVKINGCQTLNATWYVCVKYRRKTAYVPYDMFVGEKVSARIKLKSQGVYIIQEVDWLAIVKEVSRISDFEERQLIEKTGWTEPYFALRDGTVIGPSNLPEARAVFPKKEVTDSGLGTLEDWISAVADPLTGQHLLMVAVFAGFAASLMPFSGEKLNFGLELSGPAATGKTTWLHLFASIAGKPTHIPTFNATNAGFETMFNEFRDMPFPIDENSLSNSKDPQSGKEFAFRMANGTPKLTAFQPDRAMHRFLFATTSNQPFYEALKKVDAQISDAALQRLLPMRIDQSRPLGIFNFVPKGYSNAGQFAAYLGEVIALQYGTPLRHFLEAVVARRTSDPDKFQTKLRSRIAKFEARVGVSSSTRGKTRASSAFGLLYAAGRFAQDNNVLPKSWKCMVACVAGYRNYQDNLPEQTPLPTRLLTIAQRARTLDLRDGKTSRVVG